MNLWRIPYGTEGDLSAKAAPGTHEAVQSEMERLKIPKDADILELASGTGFFLKRLMRLGYRRLTSVERDLNTFRLKEITPMTLDLNTRFSQSFEKKFDVIIAIEIIEHLNSPWEFLNEINKLLKPGGTLILSTPNVSFWLSRLQFLINGYPKYFSDFDFKEQRHITPIFDHHMKIALHECGFTLDKHFSTGSSWGLILRLLTYPASLFFRMINRGLNSDGNINIYISRLS